MSTFFTHYDNLKISRDAPDSIIRSAYKTLIQQYHPDKFTGNLEDALKISKMINDAYNVLIDPVKRAKHDQWIIEQEEQLKFENTDNYLNNKNEYNHIKINYLIDKEDDLYEIATKELISYSFDHAIMGKAIINANGNEAKISACYIRIRFNELFDEAVGYCLNELKLLGCKVSQKPIFGIKKWIITDNFGFPVEIDTLDGLISITKKHQQRKINKQIIKQKEQEDIDRKAKRTALEVYEEIRLNKIKEFETLNPLLKRK